MLYWSRERREISCQVVSTSRPIIKEPSILVQSSCRTRSLPRTPTQNTSLIHMQISINPHPDLLLGLPPSSSFPPFLKPPPKHQPQSSHSPPHFLHLGPNNSSNSHFPSSSSHHSHSYYRPSSSLHSHSCVTPRSSRAPYSSLPLRARGRGRRAGDAGGLWLRGGGSRAWMSLLCSGVWGGGLDVRT